MSLYPGDQEQLARLPQELLGQMLEESTWLAEKMDGLLAPVVKNRDRLRDWMLANDPPLIQPIAAEPWSTHIAAVDGAHATDMLYAADVAVAVAVAVEGLKPVHYLDKTESTVHRLWWTAMNHDADVDRLAKAAMTVHEIELLSELEHAMCVLDGSHQSPVIALNSALSSQSSEIRARTAALCGERDIAQKLRSICDHMEGARVIAMPKSDSSTELSAFVAERSGIPVTSSDRFLASQVLEPGEMTSPIKLPEGWEKLHIKAREEETDKFVIATAEALEEAIKPLREVRSEGRGVGVFYVMPESSSAAVRVEYKASNKKEAGPLIARAVSDETVGPFMQEPFPQHVADMIAKSIGAGLGAMTSAMTSQLSTASEDYVEYLIRSHRTTGH